MSATTAHNLTEALDHFTAAFTLKAESIVLADCLADLTMASRAHIDQLAEREA